MTDDELMDRLASGDEGAARLLVERWERPVFTFLYRMLGSREEAQDLGQDTFLRLIQQADRYKPEGRFKSWLFRIAGNLARSTLRRRSVLSWIGFSPVEHDLPSTNQQADISMERAELQQSVRLAIDRLPARQRQAILLRTDQEFSYREIADVMSTSVSSVESLLQRAMSKLRQELKDKRLS